LRVWANIRQSFIQEGQLLDRLTGDQKGKGASLQHVQFDEARVDKFCAGKKRTFSLFLSLSLSLSFWQSSNCICLTSFRSPFFLVWPNTCGCRARPSRSCVKNLRPIAVGRSGPLSENKRQPARPDHQERVTQGGLESKSLVCFHFRALTRKEG
jgi:hypothetical protein